MTERGSRVRNIPAVVRPLLVLLALTLPTSACFPEDLGGALAIVNETRAPLTVFGQTVPPNGGRIRYSLSGCSPRDLVARSKKGATVAELTEKWCPGQTWTITGRGESTLE